MLAQKKMPDGRKEEISQVGPFLSVENLKYFDFLKKICSSSILFLPFHSLYCRNFLRSILDFVCQSSKHLIALSASMINSNQFCIYDEFESNLKQNNLSCFE